MRFMSPGKKLRFLKRKNIILEENYHLLSGLYQKNEKLYHDMNHHLQMIYHLAKRCECSDILDYVIAIRSPIMQLSDMIWSGNDILDAILNHARTQARENGIEMDINAEYPRSAPITSDDLCVILFNLLDNAMEASLDYKKLQHTAPVISVTIRRIHQFLIIKVQNPCVQPPRQRFGRFISTKTNSLHHGIGLKNVKEIVEKYQGEITFELKDEWFVTTALLFLSS